ncbi:MAG: S8 family serine peptidase [Propionicimonas sp.]|uniref:S8 family peptidase n=1 Tax=Propionicimonas sp. TaxID=1955623 RepID=UPI003D098E52
MFRRTLIASAALALAFALPGGASATPTTNAADRFEKAPSSGKIDSSLRPRSLTKDTTVSAIVEVKGDPVAVVEARQGRKLSTGERSTVRKALIKTQDEVAKTVTARGGKVQYQMQSAYNGMRVRINSSQLDAVAALPDVVAVHAVQTYTIDNATSVAFLGVPQVWQDTGYTGQGVKVAIIDTGVDYTHANFGGPGTTEAYEDAHAAEASAADPALFGPDAPRVKGGWDFVGDSYDADPTSATYQPTPHPDPNPLDCNGHGSHVAGTTGGDGVLSDGSTYTGPYDASTPSKDFRIGPGVAPQVDLYALRVFGCEGSTDVIVEAIDWAVAHNMDVINMSLGSTFGRADSPDAVAASNAVGAGVVVVASAGNYGPNPYIVGSPSVGNGVISVSAVDSTKSFPGALLNFSNGTSVGAVNANGADLPSTALNVVVLSGANALGCSVDAFTNAGIVPGGNQLAVVTRGTCARVAKAIYGQQAGAAAVLQINTDAGYPPVEGQITNNPDTGEDYTVTIPFLGVRSTDRAVVVAAAGGTVTLGSEPLPNPGYTKYASFSSGGPRTGDSAISPDVAAPGVSIVSTGVGTGSDSATFSGTSMAAPHVAGVAALAVQAHPTWNAAQVSSAITSTADPDKVGDQSLVRGGVGLVDPAQVVATQVVVGGDAYRTTGGWAREPSLSFGFAEPSATYVGTKVLAIQNLGARTVTYRLSSVAEAVSKPAKVILGAKSVTVKPGRTAKVLVVLKADARALGSSSGDDQFAFHQVSGDIVLTSSTGVLQVPYLLVPRAQARVTDLNNGSFPLSQWGTPSPTASPTASGSASATAGPTASSSPSGSTSPTAGPTATGALPQGGGTDGHGGPGNGGGGKPTPKPTPTQVPATSATIKLVNPGGALDADADFYTWGLKDARDVPKGTDGSGFDLRAAGVQSFATSSTDALVVFAVNNYSRWSNAVENEFDVQVDTNGDGSPDWIVISADSGVGRTGTPNGLTEVFLYKVATGDVYASGLLATAPTDSSTILLPVYASTLGLTPTAGAFTYTVESYSSAGTGTGNDAFAGSASYNPWAKAIEDGQYATVVAAKRKLPVSEVTAAIDPTLWAEQKPLGLMAVVLDNKAGPDEALLLAGR